jgi:predicted nucleic acid-binding protein
VSPTEVQPYVVDASVATKWFLDDEHGAERAQQLLHDFGAGQVHRLAPAVLPYEVANALHSAVRTQRITDEAARRSITYLHSLSIELIGGADLVVGGFESTRYAMAALSMMHYLALADAMSCRVIYADRRLQSLIVGRFSRAFWIDRYGVTRDAS